MHTSRIALALILAGLAAPALAEKCSVCDFSDEPVIVTPTKSTGAPSVNEIVVTKLTDSASEPLLSQRDRPLLRGTVPNGGEVARWSFQNAWPSKGGVERLPAIDKTTVVAPALPRGDRPMESLSLKKIEKAAPVLPAVGPAGPGFRR